VIIHKVVLRRNERNHPLGKCNDMGLRIGFLIFEGLTNLDLAGPYEVLARLPEASTFLIGKTASPVRTDTGLMLMPDKTFENAPPLDVLVVPGGPGVNQLLGDQETLLYIKESSLKAQYTTSVCTGALALGAAGLLKGRKATTHWMARDFLSSFGAQAVADRVVIDGNIITAAGVSSGIDFAFILAEKISDRITAERIQLFLEYNPAPPLNAGSPEHAGKDVVAAVQAASLHMFQERSAAIAQAVERLS
jgi:cyclohexyl-isocyanide hydratase